MGNCGGDEWGTWCARGFEGVLVSGIGLFLDLDDLGMRRDSSFVFLVAI